MAKISTIRHSLAHILAYSVKELFPGVKFGLGPAIENGFYYEFELPQPITNESLKEIEKKMRELLRKNLRFKKEVILKKEAREIFKDQPYKLELIEEIPEDRITIYKVGDFIDLCRGPHVRSTKEIPPDSFKLERIAGAYWKGKEGNPMLTRIYGIAFLFKKELKEYLKFKEEAQKRDHRVLGQKLGFFIFDKEVGAGLPLWLPKGTILREIIKKFLVEELEKEGYQWVTTPHLGNLNLWKTSGHWDLYKENIYSPIRIEKEEYLLKPMNCPFHVKIYSSKIRSYRELPIKYAEFGTVYRYERTGVLHGLMRVRGFTQDDAHIWCREDQLEKEIERVLKHGLKILKTFGFEEYGIFLSTRPERYAGTLKLWKKATKSLERVLKKLNLKYQIDPQGGVFYGPKIDIKIKDCLKRSWQCTTIQIDFNLPERFKLSFIDERGKRKTPIMIHRALLGSLERFIGVLIENYGGALPLWLAPEQIWILPVTSQYEEYAKKINFQLKTLGFRTQTKAGNETISKRIREGEIQKIPYILVIGSKEKKRKRVRVRKRKKGDLGEMSLTKFIEKIKIENERKIIF